MSAYLPTPGQLFYARAKPREVVERVPYSNVIQTRVVQDRSYSDDVFRAVATDDTLVVAKILTNTILSDTQRRLPRDEFTFLPVGPDVAKALGFDIDVGAS